MLKIWSKQFVKDKDMEHQKTKITDFWDHLRYHTVSYSRLVNAIGREIDQNGYFGGKYEFVDDIPDDSFLSMYTAGKRMLADFKYLKEKHLPVQPFPIGQDKTRIEDFCMYLRIHRLASERLINSIRRFTDEYGYIHDHSGKYEFVEDIPEHSMLYAHGFGKRMLAEFKEVKAKCLPLRPDAVESISKALEERSKKRFVCWLLPDTFKRLKTIENQDSFVEAAILEKFERDGIIDPAESESANA